MGNSSFKARIDKHFGSDFLPDGSPLEGAMVFLLIVASAACAYTVAFTSLHTRTFVMEKWKKWVESLSTKPVDSSLRPPAEFELGSFQYHHSPPTRPNTPESDGSPAPLRRKNDTLPKAAARKPRPVSVYYPSNSSSIPISASVHRLTSASQTDLVGPQVLSPTAPLYRPQQACLTVNPHVGSGRLHGCGSFFHG